MRKAIIVIVMLGLVLVGCAQVEPIAPPAPIPPVQPVDAPEDVDWVSPGKVWVSNFHTDARAEWYITVHNGSGKESPFRIEYKYPARTDLGYYKAPPDVVQDWVIVTDSTLVLAPWETRDVLVALVMPPEVPEQRAQFLQFTKDGSDYLVESKRAFWEKHLAGFMGQYPNRPEVARAKANETITEAWKGYVSENPQFDLLVYLDNKGSLSWELFYKDRMVTDEVFIGEFKERQYVIEGNLLKDKWEFWVDVKDVSQTGEVQVSMAVRWLVSMRV